MSNKKMKGVALDSLVYGDSKAMLKHQTLLHVFQDLRKDVEASRYKLGRMKQKREALLAEVRFLRRRYKYLLKSKSAKLTQEHLQPRYVENQGKHSVKVHISNKKEGIPRVLKLKRKGGVLGNENSVQNTNPSFDPNYKRKKLSGKNAAHANPPTTSNLHPSGQLYKGKEVAHQNFTAVVNLNQERVYNKTYATMLNAAPILDLNQETAFSGNQSHFQIQAPTFDLNQISREEELQNNCEGLQSEETKKGSINEDVVSDLRLSLCRNIGNSSNNTVKRKISWQDPVALRV